MATTIVTKSGSGAPTASDLVAGELAVDLTNKRLYTEDSGGTVLELGTNPSGNVTFGDNGKAIFGAGSDLQIYHDGVSNRSYITESNADGNGHFFIQGDNLILENTGGENYFRAINGGAVQLYHSGNEKLATTATGIDVVGTAEAHKVEIGDGSAGGTSEILFSDNVSARGKILYDHSSIPETMVLQTTGTTAISIDNSQNVSMPNGNLDVTGSVTADGLTVNSGTANNVATFASTDAYALIKFEDSATTTETTLGAYANDMVFRVGAIERLRIDSSGNVGIGVVPAAWRSNYDVLQIGAGGQLAADDTNASRVFLQANTYVNASNVHSYLSTDEASQYWQTKGTHIFNVAPSGTADSAVTWTTAMTIDNAGLVGIGTDLPTQLLNLESATNPAILITDTTNTTSLLLRSQNNTSSVGTNSNHPLVFETNATEAMRIDSSGNVGIGESDPAEKLEVAGNILLNASNAEVNLKSGVAGTSGAINWTFNTDSTDFASIKLPYDDRNTTGLHIDSGYPITIDASGTGTIFAQSGSEVMRIDSSGHAIIPAGVTLGTAAGVYAAANTLDDYEEGTWTPADGSGAGLTFSTAVGTYTKVGNLVTVAYSVTYPSTVDTTDMAVGGLPFAPDVNFRHGGSQAYTDKAAAFDCSVTTLSSKIIYRTGGTSAPIHNNELSSGSIRGSITYQV